MNPEAIHKSRSGVVAARAERKVRIDLGLTLLSMLVRPGVRLTHEDIAAWAGCTSNTIKEIEKRAFFKMRARLGSEWREMLSAR